MPKALMLGLILVLVLVVIGGLLYWFYEKPVQEEAAIQYHNVSIRAFDADTGKPIEATYTIITDGGETLEGTTNTEGFTLRQVQVNQSFTTYVASEGYYTAVLEPYFDITIPRPVRYQPELTPIGSLEVKPLGTLGEDNPLPVALEAKGSVRDLKACVRWSNNLLEVSVVGATRAEKEPRLRYKVDRCYALNFTLANEQEIIQLSYSEYLPLTSDDSITLHILYGDASSGAVRWSTDYEKPLLKDDVVVTIQKD